MTSGKPILDEQSVGSEANLRQFVGFEDARFFGVIAWRKLSFDLAGEEENRQLVQLEVGRAGVAYVENGDQSNAQAALFKGFADSGWLRFLEPLDESAGKAPLALEGSNPSFDQDDATIDRD